MKSIYVGSVYIILIAAKPRVPARQTKVERAFIEAEARARFCEGEARPPMFVDCGEPGTPANGTKTGTAYTYNSAVSFACNTGYTFEGDSQRTCGADAQWTGTQPNCTIVDCGDPGTPANGEKTGRGIIAQRFQRAVAGPKGKAKVVAAIGDPEQKLVDWEWNTLRIVAVGNQLIHQVNGINTMELTDNHPEALSKGVLGLQLHAGAPMRVEFKEIQYRPLKGKEAKAVLKAAKEKK